MADSLANLVSRLERAVVTMEKIVVGTSSPAEPGSAPVIAPEAKPSTPARPIIVVAYEEALLSKFPALIELSAKIDPQVTVVVRNI